MFEEARTKLDAELDTILTRMIKGMDMINKLPLGDNRRDKFVKTYNRLKVQASRGNACLDILSGELNLIVEQGGNIIITRKDTRGHLVEEALKIGAVMTDIEEV